MYIGENVVKTVTILGVNFNNVNLSNAVDIAMDKIRNDEKGYVVTPNSEIAYLCQDDDKLMHAVNNASLILPDGIGVIHAAKILGTPLSGKVAGVDFAAELMRAMASEGKSLYLIGAKPGVAEKAAQNLKKKYPGLIVTGYRDGYFKSAEEAVSSINAVGKTDVVFVCLGAPKQEFFMQQELQNINATLLCGLGGSLDVFAGIVQRAPDIFIKLGLEWFYRLIKEPQRAGRMMKLPLFILSAIKIRFLGGKK